MFNLALLGEKTHLQIKREKLDSNQTQPKDLQFFLEHAGEPHIIILRRKGSLDVSYNPLRGKTPREYSPHRLATTTSQGGSPMTISYGALWLLPCTKAYPPQLQSS